VEWVVKEVGGWTPLEKEKEVKRKTSRSARFPFFGSSSRWIRQTYGLSEGGMRLENVRRSIND